MKDSVGNARSELRMISSAKVKNALKNNPYQFVKIVLTDTAEKGGLYKVLYRNIDLWKPSASFMNAFS